MSSVKKNFAYSSILTIAGYLFPLITFPYVTRVLGVEGIGKYNFAAGVIQYFTAFAMLGINTVGIRAIAKVKDDIIERSKTFSSLLVLNLSTTILSIIILLGLVAFIPSFKEHDNLLYIGISQLLAGSLVVEWLFKGLEDFKYITVRAIIVRSLYVVAVLLFVKTQDDYSLYFLLTSLTVVTNAIINLLYSRKFIRFSLKELDIKKYLSQFLILGVYQILTAMYVSFNTIYLGTKCGDIEVGYYATATKLYGLIMSFFTAFTGVMLPRMSALVAEGDNQGFMRMTNKSIDVLLLFSIPIIIVSEIFAPVIISIIAGPGYENSILSFRIVMPLMFVIGYEQIIIIQMLSPLQKDKAILINSFMGASVALILNILLVPHLGSVGSSIVWCCCELTVLISAQLFVSKYIGYNFPFRRVFYSLLGALPVLGVCLVTKIYIPNSFFSLLMGGVEAFFLCGMFELYVTKNEVAITVYNDLKRVVCRKKCQ